MAQTWPRHHSWLTALGLASGWFFAKGPLFFCQAQSEAHGPPSAMAVRKNWVVSGIKCLIPRQIQICIVFADCIFFLQSSSQTHPARVLAPCPQGRIWFLRICLESKLITLLLCTYIYSIYSVFDVLK